MKPDELDEILYRALTSVMPELVQSTYDNAFLEAKQAIQSLISQKEKEAAIRELQGIQENYYIKPASDYVEHIESRLQELKGSHE